MARRFEAQLENFSRLTQDKAERVVKQSVQEVIGIAQTTVAQGGRMPVVTSFLRNSLASELNGSQMDQGPDAATLTIALMKPGDLMRFGWTAPYARARHYKPNDYGQGGGYWRDNAAEQVNRR